MYKRGSWRYGCSWGWGGSWGVEVYGEAILIIGILMDRLSKDETRKRRKRNLPGMSPSASKREAATK